MAKGTENDEPLITEKPARTAEPGRNKPQVTPINGAIAHPMVAKFLASRLFLFLLIGATLLLLLLLTFARIQQLVTMFRFPDYASSLEDNETISTLLVGLGIVLEGRAVLVRKAHQAQPLPPGAFLNELDEEFEYYGVFLLILGVLMEIITQFIRFLNVHLYFVGMPLVARLVMQGLALTAVVVLVRVILLVFVKNKLADTSHEKQ